MIFLNISDESTTFEGMKQRNTIAAIAITIILILSTYLVLSNTTKTDEPYPLPLDQTAIQKGLHFLKNKMDENGCIQSVHTTAWAAIAIASTGDNLSNWEPLKHYLQNSIHLLNKSHATDWERHCLALIAFHIDPTNVSGINIIRKIKDFHHNGQIGSENNIYDDIFGVIALYSYGEPYSEILQDSINTILTYQDTNGSWGDVDTTAAAINALACYNTSMYKTQIQKALTFIKEYQSDTGGFYSWGSCNSASTSWVLYSLNALEEKPNTDPWRKNGKSPVDYLLELQQPDGSFLYTENSSMNIEWMTTLAILALSGGNFIQNT